MPKTLDHRISKTYDIKPVDKKGNLDVDRISRREILVRLKNEKREEKAAQMMNRFEASKKKALQERLIFDIGAKRVNVSKEQEVTKIEQKNEKEEAVLLAENQQEESQNSKEVLDKSEVEAREEANDAQETPAEVFENFRKAFEEKEATKKPNSDDEKVGSEQEIKLGDYCVIHGNQFFASNKVPEFSAVKLGKAILKKSALRLEEVPVIEETKEKLSFEKEIEKGRILTSELIKKEDVFVKAQENNVIGNKEEEAPEKIEVIEQWMKEEPEKIITKKREESCLLAEDVFTESEKKDDRETQKESQEKSLNDIVFSKNEEHSFSDIATTREEKSNLDDDFEKVLQEKSKFNEAAIDNKLNAWFDYGVVEPTSEKKDINESVIIKEKAREPELAVRKEESKPEKKEIKFTGKIVASKIKKKKKKKFFSLNYRKKGEAFNWRTLVAKPLLSFMTVSFVAFLLIGTIVFVSYGFQIQENVKVKGEQALGYLDDAKNQLKGQDFLSAKTSFASAVKEFEDAQKELDLIGGDMLDVFSTFPILSKISSGKNVVDAGNELTKAAKELSGVIEALSQMESPFDSTDVNVDNPQESMLDALLVMQEKLKVADESLMNAQKSLALVKIADLPEEYQGKFQKIQETLPLILSMIDTFEQNSEIFLELLGHNGPRKYLLLFQNNQEMRATGGFIGSYGILHISNGKISKLLIEGIYNPDGQLKYNIVPPLPIQKISASWSTHDANWFPSFPKTAQKVSDFYEYTGGPTVDGIITINPIVLQRMLAVTGPIEMEEYDTTVNAENFVEATQYEVEVDYDKTENEPKQFLADLAPKIITKLFDAKDPGDASQVLEIFSDMLKERNIMLYSTNKEVQAAISKRGWSGEILPTEKDYLMVINSNINGFKTDGVIDESITHNAKIAEDGTITDTVKIKRVHNGGDTNYEWWNKVNADYMRVYVPKGSKFLSVKGQTREINEPLLDYDKLGFKRDPDVVHEEDSIKLDEETGTRIYEEEGKTVFANWVYVSPKETVEIEYTYELPFKLDTSKNQEAVDTYSLLVQKQAGSFGSEISSDVEYESEIKPIWTYPQDIERKESSLEVKTKLITDLFFGAVFQKEGARAEDKK